MNSNFNKNIYFCDHCYTEQYETLDNGKIKPYKDYFRCSTKQKWIAHCKTRKHKYNCSMIQTLEDDLIETCKHCNETMTKEAYKHHKTRNALFWAVKSNSDYNKCSCNNFVLNGEAKRKMRFPSIQTLSTYINMEREPNGRTKRTYQKKTKQFKTFLSGEPKKEEVEENIKIDIEEIIEEIPEFTKICKCGLPRNEPYMTKSKQEKYGIELCSKFCDEDTTEEEDDLTEGDHLILDEYGTKIPFEDYCGDCNKPINKENYNSNLLVYLDIVVCDCEDE